MPTIIEFTGSPTSGKTTLIGGIDSLLRHNGFTVMRPQEGAEVFRTVSREIPMYNVLTGCYAMQNVIQGFSTIGDRVFILLDRALYDAHAWMLFWERRGKLTKEKRVRFQSFFTDIQWLKNISACLYVFCEPEEAMARARKDAPTKFPSKEGNYANERTIHELIGIFSESFEEMQQKKNPVSSINTTHLTKPEMFDKACECIFQQIGLEL
ncbi:hypothetical protein IIA95_00325 [Patescibacteria group bacterium]|nr:hypothetical protein [Patescibacteria group bacterium]